MIVYATPKRLKGKTLTFVRWWPDGKIAETHYEPTRRAAPEAEASGSFRSLLI